MYWLAIMWTSANFVAMTDEHVVVFESLSVHSRNMMHIHHWNYVSLLIFCSLKIYFLVVKVFQCSDTSMNIDAVIFRWSL